MKKTYFYGLISVFILLALSCKEKSSPIDLDEKYIEPVEVISPKAAKVQVDNFAHFITIDFAKGTDISKVNIKLNLTEGITMSDPKETTLTCDLTKEILLKVQKGASIIPFKVKSNLVVVSFNPSDKGWIKNETFGTLPGYLSVYKYTKTVDSKAVEAYIAVADINNGNARFSVLGEKHYDKPTPTPTQFYENNSQPKILLNGGYFWDGYSLGLLIRNSKTINIAQTMVWRNYNGVSTVYYPTNGVFGQNSDGTFSAHWAYSPDINTFYTYSAPSPNKMGEAPQALPSATFPSTGQSWAPKEAIGAGPVLIKEGKYKNLWEAEMLDAGSGIGPTVDNPRSAVGYNPNGYLVFFVCEGRNKTPNTPGLTLKNVADLLMEIGCTEALNLDGGGSSCMLINGKETIKPSDGKQRSITNGIALY